MPEIRKIAATLRAYNGLYLGFAIIRTYIKANRIKAKVFISFLQYDDRDISAAGYSFMPAAFVYPQRRFNTTKGQKKTFTTTAAVVKVLLLRTNSGDESRTDEICCAFASATP